MILLAHDIADACGNAAHGVAFDLVFELVALAAAELAGFLRLLFRDPVVQRRSHGGGIASPRDRA